MAFIIDSSGIPDKYLLRTFSKIASPSLLPFPWLCLQLLEEDCHLADRIQEEVFCVYLTKSYCRYPCTFQRRGQKASRLQVHRLLIVELPL